MPSSGVFKTIAEKLAVIAWIEEHGDGIPTWALKHFRDELNWKISGSQQKSATIVEEAVAPQSNGETEKTRAWRRLEARSSRSGGHYFSIKCSTSAPTKRRRLGAIHEPLQCVLMDETSVHFYDPKCQTVDLTGVRHVLLRSTGFVSMRVTVVLAFSALGKKLTPLVIWKGTKQGSKVQKIGTIYVMFQEREWVDSAVLSEWIDMMFPIVLDHGKGKFLVWDAMRAHISKATKAKCKAKEVGMCAIPGGLTSYLQAGDIGTYSSLKEKLSSFINSWKSSDKVDYTRGGNTRPSKNEAVAPWVALEWKDVPDTVVQKSVAAAGYSDGLTQCHIARHDVHGDMFRMNQLDRERHDFADVLLDQSLIYIIDEFTIEDYP
uniref:Uncharacterized protein AlNc14C214G8973 n=1 Tax=Albugo laibachii Nc14 TaxID=890382 RepID=F0WRH1_9STRA|nr:conserved hypothetical protein [Albugo laibachii Nc14]|eukprot:CCA23934.1 conserved hypothetical protein [Albugo laibachii Nc14]